MRVSNTLFILLIIFVFQALLNAEDPYSAGSRFLSSGDPESAAAYFEQAFEEAENLQLKCNVSYSAINAYIQLGDIARAVFFCNFLREKGSSYQKQHGMNNLIKLYLSMNRIDKASDIVEEGLTLSEMFKRDAALICVKRGEFEKAARLYEEFYLFSRNEEVLEHIRKLYLDTNMFSERFPFWNSLRIKYPKLYAYMTVQKNPKAIQALVTELQKKGKLSSSNLDFMLSQLWQEKQIAVSESILLSLKSDLLKKREAYYWFRQHMVSDRKKEAFAVIDRCMEEIVKLNETINIRDIVVNHISAGKYADASKKITEFPEAFSAIKESEVKSIDRTHGQNLVKKLIMGTNEMRKKAQESHNSILNSVGYMKTTGLHDEALSILFRLEQHTGEQQETYELLAMLGKINRFVDRLNGKPANQIINLIRKCREIISAGKSKELIDAISSNKHVSALAPTQRARVYLSADSIERAADILVGVDALDIDSCNAINAVKNRTEKLDLVSRLYRLSPSSYRINWMRELLNQAKADANNKKIIEYSQELFKATGELSYCETAEWYKMMESGERSSSEVLSFASKYLERDYIIETMALKITPRENLFRLGSLMQTVPETAETILRDEVSKSVEFDEKRSLYLLSLLRMSVSDYYTSSRDKDFDRLSFLAVNGIFSHFWKEIPEKTGIEFQLLHAIFTQEINLDTADQFMKNWDEPINQFILLNKKDKLIVKEFILDKELTEYYSSLILSD